MKYKHVLIMYTKTYKYMPVNPLQTCNQFNESVCV